MDATITNEPGQIAISGEMNIYAAATLQQQLFALLRDAPGSLQIDLGKVTAIDTSGVQLLLMLQRIGKRDGMQHQFAPLSEVVRDAFTLCGLSELLPAASAEAA